jgi:hypothetical protein
MDLTFEQIKELIILGVSQLIVLFGGLAAAYAKIQRDVQKKIDRAERGVKNHTDMSVRKLNGTVSYIIHGFDSPAWIKIAETNSDDSIEFRMLEVNEHYAMTYGITRADYIGKTDLEVGWPKEIAEGFKANDLLVWASGKAQTFEEKLPDGEVVYVRKMLLKNTDGQIKGILGYEASPEDI